MAADFFSRIQVPEEPSRITDPIEIFQGASISDGSINDLWLAQGDALREWHTLRDKKDLAIVLNTGAGKTLVGLLIAQSLVNETQRQVVYACSSIQLVQQTADKAKGYGLPVSTYHQQQFSSDNLYQRAQAPCITTYQALFNGRSRFRRDDIAAVVFDDAHTVDNILREQFSLHILRSELPALYDQIVNLYKQYHNSVGRATSYADVCNGISDREFFLPPFEILRNIEELRRLLREANLSQNSRTMFSWEHIQDHEDLCCVLVSKDSVTLTPPVIPTFTLSYFSESVRRIYLSATLTAPDSFIRVFGHQPDNFITPSTTAGECERMLVIPSMAEGIEDEIAAAKEIIKEHKALILVPSFARGEAWNDIAAPPSRETVPKEVSSFREAVPPQKLTLAARYDGIDLPGDTCRMMVLDGLPTGSGPLERFQWDSLSMENSLRSMLASRIVQSFGRISRGMSDHGVVILTGQDLIRWLDLPRNRSLLPEFLQKQIRIGQSISEGASGADVLSSMVATCLDRATNWTQFYATNMRDLSATTTSFDLDEAFTIASAEARFGRELWNRNYQRAAQVLNEAMDNAFRFSHCTGAWLSLWLGYSYELLDDLSSAHYFYRKAHSVVSNIPGLPVATTAPDTAIPVQVVRVAEQIRIGHANTISISIPKSIHSDFTALNGRGSPSQTEEALRCLGQYLGLDSIRPDNEFDIGPDVLWIGEQGFALCMEVKTDKQIDSRYRKDEIGQLHNHVQWTRDHREISVIVPIFVGPILPVTNSASPSPEMGVVELAQFESLAEKLLAALEDVTSRALPLSLESDLHEMLGGRGLLFPDAFMSLEMHKLQERQEPSD